MTSLSLLVGTTVEIQPDSTNIKKGPRIYLKKNVSFAAWHVFYVDAGDNYRVDGGPLTLP